MKRQPGLFDMEERLRRLSDMGDQLEAFTAVVDFERLRPVLDAAFGYGDGSKGGRPPLDPVMMFKILVIRAQNNLSDDRTEFLINDRLSARTFPWLGALGPGSGREDDLIVPRTADEGRRLYDAAMEALPERAACKLVVGALAIAHERGCETDLAAAIGAQLDAGIMPDLAELCARFAPNPEALPQITVTLTPLSAYDALTAAPTEGAQS